MPVAFKKKEDATAYQNRYIAQTYDRINLTVAKGRKDTIKAHAESRGESVNGFINRAIDEAMERDNAAPCAAEVCGEGNIKAGE